MSANVRKVLIIIGIVVIAIVAIRMRTSSETKVRELKGAVVTKFDPAARTAEIEFKHPKSGKPMRLAGTVTPECEVLVNNEPAELAELRVGDKVDVRGVIHQGFTEYTVEARWVNAHRPTAETQPTTTSAPATP